MGQVIAGAGLACLRAGADNGAVGHHSLERQNVFAHGAVANGSGAAGAGGGHAADAGIRAGVHGEKQSGGAQLLVQGDAGDARLDDAIQILGIHFQNAVHPVHIQTDAAAGRQMLTLERTCRAIGHHGAVMGVTDFQNVRDLLRGLGIGYGVGRCQRIPRLVLSVQIAVGLGRDQTVPK